MRTNQVHSNTWINFVYGSFFGSILLSGIGIFFLPTELWTKGYLAMGFVMTVMTSIILTKTIRDNFESEKHEIERPNTSSDFLQK
jgi:hypothetical protein